MNIKYNINESVKVKLTPLGKNILKEKHDSLNKELINKGLKGFGELKLKIDEQGYYNTQMWCLMQDFGEYLGLAVDLPFETEIICCNGELE